MKLSDYKNYIINKYGETGWEDYKSTYAYTIYSLTEEEQKRKLQNDGNNIQYINNPSEELQLIAVKENGCAIKYIDNPSEKVQLEAISSHPSSIYYINNPCEDAQILAVGQDPNVIIDIKNPTEIVLQEAIKKIDFYFYGMHLLKHLENDLKGE